MSVLLDVNVLVALLDPGHVFHDVAQDWFGSRETSWATCPVSENGTIRVISHPRYPNSTGTASAAVELVSRLRGLPGHVFWPDAVSLLDPEVCDVDHLTTSGRVTDSYLLALAVANSGSLATFDKRLVTSAKSVEPKARCAYWAAPDRRGCRVRDAHSGSGGCICEAPLWAHRIGGARPCLDRRMRRHESRPARSPASVCFQRPMVRPHADPAGRTGSGAT